VFDEVRRTVLKSQPSSVARWPGCDEGLDAAESIWAPLQQPGQGANSRAPSPASVYLPAAEAHPWQAFISRSVSTELDSIFSFFVCPDRLSFSGR